MDICSTVFTVVALLIIASTWKQLRFPSNEEWVKKMWYIYITEYYSAAKSNDILKFASKWMELEKNHLE